jgi:Ca-activated chloride channel family protein
MPDFGFDKWIDAQLRNVPLPHKLLSRLSEAGDGSNSRDADARLDAALSDVAVPAYLETRLQHIAFQGRPLPLGRQILLAASIFLALSLGVLAYASWATHVLGPDQVALNEQVNPQSIPMILPAAKLPASQIVEQPSDVSVPAEERQNIPAESVVAEIAKLSVPAFQRAAEVGTEWKQALEARIRAEAALGADGGFDRLPELDSVETQAMRGVKPPRVRGYDLMFQLKHGEHPVVSPAVHPELVSSKMPFTFRTASYDLTQRGAVAGQLPRPEEIRVEDFLAALDYPLPQPPATGLALHAAGTVSPFGENGLHLLELAVQAAGLRQTAHPPTRLIAIVDTSSRMRFAARDFAVARALDEIAKHMAKADRITLMGFAERPSVLAENVTPEDLQAFVRSGAFPKPHGVPDLARAIDAVCQAAKGEKTALVQRVALISAGRADLDEFALKKAEKVLGELSAAKIPWQVIRVGSSEVESQLAELARRTGGQFTTAAAPTDIFAALLEQLVGQSSTVAKGASLKVTFNPQVVTGYRLMGHESATLTGPAADPLEIDLHALQVAVGLYEVWIRPNGDDTVATAELTWTDPTSGQARRVARPIRRELFAASFSAAPTWLRQGVISAKTAEALRGSYYAPATHPFAHLAHLAEEIDPAAAQQGEFPRLMQLLKQAGRLR